MHLAMVFDAFSFPQAPSDSAPSKTVVDFVVSVMNGPSEEVDKKKVSLLIDGRSVADGNLSPSPPPTPFRLMVNPCVAAVTDVSQSDTDAEIRITTPDNLLPGDRNFTITGFGDDTLSFLVEIFDSSALRIEGYPPLRLCSPVVFPFAANTCDPGPTPRRCSTRESSYSSPSSCATPQTSLSQTIP